MALPQWPAALPQRLPIETQDEPQSNVVTFEPDVGPPVRRRRATAATRLLRPPADKFVLDEDQWDTLLDFYRNMVREVEPFTWEDPLKGLGVVTLRFPEPPKRTATVPGLEPRDRFYRVQLVLEIQP